MERDTFTQFVIAVVAAFLGALFVMILWDACIPALFGLKPISCFHALMLQGLTSALFKPSFT
jgi:hypothetical protein